MEEREVIRKEERIERARERQEEREMARRQNEQYIEMISKSLDEEQKSRAAERGKCMEVIDGSLKETVTVLKGVSEMIAESLEHRREK